MTSSPVLYPDTEPLEGTVALRLLGPTEYDGRPVTVAASCMQVFAVLAVRAGAHTTVEDLTLELWGKREPRSARQTVQTYILQLRNRLGRELVVTKPLGYTLNVAKLGVDVHRFDHLLVQAKQEFNSGDFKGAEDTLLAGLSLWRGSALQEVRLGQVLSGAAAGLADRRRSAMGLLFDMALRQGRHRDVVDELASLARLEPAHEDWTALLMVALYRSRRRADALRAFAELRTALVDEHGIDPCPELRRLQQQILRGDPSLELNGETR